MKYPMTPMDFALAGLSLWRRQAQSAAMMAMRMAPAANGWSMAPTEALEELSRTQAEMALATQKLSLAMLDAAAAQERPNR